MKIIFNAELNGFQIVHLKNQFTKPEIWNKPVNNKVYGSWDNASADLDKWSE